MRGGKRGSRKRGGRSRSRGGSRGGGRASRRNPNATNQHSQRSGRRAVGGVGGGRFVPSHATGAPAGMDSALSDSEAPFLKPRPRRLQPVPLEFATVGEWCSCMAHNLLAEFWHIYREGSSGPSLRARVIGQKQLLLSDTDDDGLNQHLLLIDRTLHLVLSQQPAMEGGTMLSVRPALRTHSSSPCVRDLGYIGSFTAELSALIDLSTQPPNRHSPVLQSILTPRQDRPGDYVSRPLRSEVPINPSQRRAVGSLQYALEKIQGPPGTGKSTTIFHIITARLPPSARVLVTCSRNVAVESIAQKLYECSPDRLIVFGNASRIGDTARSLLVDAQCEEHPRVQRVAAFEAWVIQLTRDIQSGWRRRMEAVDRCNSRGWRRAIRALTLKRFGLVRRLVPWLERIGQIASAFAEGEAENCKAEILQRSTILLCTIASTSRMLREWEEHVGGPLNVHTAIIDECGCTAEASVGLLLRMQLRNLILVGDHKQLPPTSMVPPSELEGTGHTRSLLERCVLASGAVHRLTEQYRMHPDIAQVVSGLFYHSLLETPDSVRQDREVAMRDKAALVWVDIGAQRGESTPERSKSLQNLDEVKLVCSVAVALRSANPHATIAVLTFYKGQLLEIMRTLAASLKVEVLTVDACQGSEFDFVVLSTVRSNSCGKLGFVKDRQRICVAISRAMRQLVIVGCADTLAADSCWRIVNSRAEPQLQRHWETLGRVVSNAMPAGGSGRSVLEELAKDKANAREAILSQTAVSLMRQQPSLNAPRRREKPNHSLRVSTSDSISVPVKNLVQPDEAQYETAFPMLGASHAPARALHVVETSQQQHVHGAAAPNGDSGWDVSEAMLVDMFGEKRVGTALSMLGGDLQRAFVVLLETDGLNDDDNAIDDEEWDYEPPPAGEGFISSIDAEDASSERRGEEDLSRSNGGTNGVIKENAGASGFLATRPHTGCMSVEAAPFVPGESVVQETYMVDEAVMRRKARERALQILAAGTSSSEDLPNVKGPGASADKNIGGKGGSRAVEEELRVDPADGLLYCKADFLIEYGRTAEWDAAVVATPRTESVHEIPMSKRKPEVDCAMPELEPEPEPEPPAPYSYPLYVSGSDSDDTEVPFDAHPASLAVELLANGQTESTPAAESMALLIDMGFERDLARRAIELHPDSVEAAAAWILQGEPDGDTLRSADAPELSSQQPLDDLGQHLSQNQQDGDRQAQNDAPAAGQNTEDQERRVDPSDGNAYTQAEFMIEYGSLDEWNAATPLNATYPPTVFTCSDQAGIEAQASTSTTQVETLNAYVLRGLQSLGVDDDLCDYFAGMMMAMVLSMEEDASPADGFDEGIDNLVELLVDGYGCEEAAARNFITSAPGLTSRMSLKPSATVGQHRAESEVGKAPGGVRRVRSLPGVSKMNVGIEVTDWVKPEEQPWQN